MKERFTLNVTCVDSTCRQPRFRAVVFIAALYALVGIAFALPASRVRAWRLAAWAVSGVVYAVHLVFERFHRRNSSLLTALTRLRVSSSRSAVHDPHP